MYCMHSFCIALCMWVLFGRECGVVLVRMYGSSIVQARLTWAFHSWLDSISAPFSASICTRCLLPAAEEDMIERKKMEMTFNHSTLLFKLYIYKTWVQVFDMWHAYCPLYVTESIKCFSYLAIQCNLIWQQLYWQYVLILHTVQWIVSAGSKT